MENLLQGRIVHYTYKKIHLAAVVTFVYKGVSSGLVDLYIFPNDTLRQPPDKCQYQVMFDENHGEGTWHWAKKDVE